MAQERTIVYKFDASSAKQAQKHTLEFRRELALLKIANGDVKTATDQYGFSATKLDRILKELSARAVLGLKHSITSLNKDEIQLAKQAITTGQALKQQSGLTNLLKKHTDELRDAMSQLGVHIPTSPILLVAAAVAALIAGVVKAGSAAKDFIVDTLKLANAEDKSRAAVIAMVGSVEEGTIAYEQWKKRAAGSKFPGDTYSIEDYVKAVTQGLGPALLDAEEAFSGSSLSAANFVKQLNRMREGYAPLKKTVYDYSAVLKEAGLTIKEVTDADADHVAQAKLLEEALARMAQRQREALDKTVAGNIEEITNRWIEYKKEIGHILNEGLAPLIKSAKEMFFEFLKTGDLLQLFRELANILKIIGPLIANIFKFLAADLGLVVRTATVMLDIFGRLLQTFRAVGEVLNKTPLSKPFEDLARGVSLAQVAVMALLGPLGLVLASLQQIAEVSAAIQKKDWAGALRAAGPGRFGEIYGGMTAKIAGITGQKTGGAGAEWGGVPGQTIVGQRFDEEGEEEAQKKARPKREMKGLAGIVPLTGPEMAAADLREEYLKKQREARRRVKQGEALPDAHSAAMAVAAEDAKTKAAMAKTFTGALFDAATSEQVKQAFIDLGVDMLKGGAKDVLGATAGAMAGAGSFLDLLPGGSLLKMLFGGGQRAFEREGLVTRPTFGVIGEAGPEYIMKPATIAAISRGFSPRGGAEGHRFGPEDYRSGGTGVNVNINPKVGALVDVEISHAAERGMALRSNREA